MTRDEFIEKWQHEADRMRRRKVLVDGALLCEEILEDLQALLRSEEDRLLTLTQAAQRSGYTIDHVGRLLRTGQLANAGRKGSPRVRAGDLPRKPFSRARSTGPYDPDADARELAVKRQFGNQHD